MNNMNIKVEIQITGKLKIHSPAWTAFLRTEVQTRLQAMQRTYSETDFLKATEMTESINKLDLAGVTFLVYTF